jgi:hypothetical protein
MQKTRALLIFDSFKDYRRDQTTSLHASFQKSHPQEEPFLAYDEIMRLPSLTAHIQMRDEAEQEKNPLVYWWIGIDPMVVVTEIRSAMNPVGSILTWSYRNGVDDPCKTLRKHSLSYVIHQTPPLIDQTLTEISTLFKNALAHTAKPGAGMNRLQHNVALFRFYFAYCAPFSEGNEIIADLFEAIIYHHHDIHLQFRQGASPATDPFTHFTWDSFFPAYCQARHLVRNHEDPPQDSSDYIL